MDTQFEVYIIETDKMDRECHFSCFYEVNFKWLEAKENIVQNEKFGQFQN